MWGRSVAHHWTDDPFQASRHASGTGCFGRDVAGHGAELWPLVQTSRGTGEWTCGESQLLGVTKRSIGRPGNRLGQRTDESGISPSSRSERRRLAFGLAATSAVAVTVLAAYNIAKVATPCLAPLFVVGAADGSTGLCNASWEDPQSKPFSARF